MHGTSLRWGLLRGTRAIWITIALVTSGQFLLTYWPPLQRVFGTEAVPLAEGLLVVGLGVAFFLALEAEKLLRLSLRRAAAT
jgi:hypothetical protein